EGVPAILREFLPHVCSSPFVVMVAVDALDRIAHALDIAESRQRFRAGLLRRHPRREVLLNPRFEMEAELVRDVRGDVGAPEAHVAAPGRSSHSILRGQTAAVVAVSTFETACENTAQLEVSARSWRRPSVVIV